MNRQQKDPSKEPWANLAYYLQKGESIMIHGKPSRTPAASVAEKPLPITRPAKPRAACRFSILIPSYNRAGFIPATLESVFAQSFKDYEIIVVDDGSTDQTPAVLRNFGNRITAIRQENQGAEVARKTAERAARGEYIVLLDSDDLLLPGALEAYDSVIQEFDLPPLVIGALRPFSSTRPLPSEADMAEAISVKVYRDFLARDTALVFASSHIVIRADIALKYGALPEVRTAFPFEPCDIMLTLGGVGPCVAIMSPPNVGYRTHESNACGDRSEMVKKIPLLVDLERSGRYAKGTSSRFERWAYIGGVTGSYVKHSIMARDYRGALELATRSFPMILSAFLRKFSMLLHRRMVVITVPNRKPKWERPLFRAIRRLNALLSSNPDAV